MTFDLAARRLGGVVLHANDEFFAPKENLLDPLAPRFDPGGYGPRGKVMDGWETRRRRTPGHDWCLIRLGAPGVVHEFVVDTTHFRGNFPEAASVQGCLLDGHACVDDLLADDVEWTELLARSDLAGNSVNTFPAAGKTLVSHLRLAIHPDGGVARFRALGEVVGDLRRTRGSLDLASVVNGGRAVDCSDAFFSSPQNLCMVGDAVDMGDGWETQRRRSTGYDWAVIELGATGVIERVEVDTTHFNGNYPDHCVVEACHAPGGLAEAQWREIVPPSPLGPHARHVLAVDGEQAATHVRLRIHPDGGVARMRVFGQITDEGWDRAGLRRLNALPAGRAEAELHTCCAAEAWTRQMAAARPFADIPALEAAADAVWASLGPADRLEAFNAHPRIGERSASAWAREEQAGTAGAADGTLARLEAGNAEYEQRFGHVFLICASGLSAEQMLHALTDRLGNSAEDEARMAAEEQRKITRIRLRKLMRP